MSRLDKLFVFDFDDTLVRTTSFIHVIQTRDNSIKAIRPHEFYEYQLLPGEVFDFNEFEGRINLKTTEIIKRTWDKFLEKIETHGSKAVSICTARTMAGPVSQFLADVECPVIEVAAVGHHIKNGNPTLANAIRKQLWFKDKLKDTNPREVHFYDDNLANIVSIGELRDIFPDINIITHLIGASD